MCIISVFKLCLVAAIIEIADPKIGKNNIVASKMQNNFGVIKL